MCAFIVGAVLLIFFIASAGSWLEQNPWGWLVVLASIGLVAAVWYLMRKRKIANGLVALQRIADELEVIVTNFADIDSFLALRKGEKAIYERSEVQLREYKRTGSTYKGGNAGVIIRATSNVGFTLGGSQGSMTPNPEEQTIIDTGTAIFTNQRILFAGPNHTREWEFDKLITYSTGDNGFVVDLAVSNRTRASALAADSANGITPGIMATICIELFQNGEESARAWAQELITDIRKKVAEHKNK